MNKHFIDPGSIKPTRQHETEDAKCRIGNLRTIFGNGVNGMNGELGNADNSSMLSPTVEIILSNSTSAISETHKSESETKLPNTTFFKKDRKNFQFLTAMKSLKNERRLYASMEKETTTQNPAVEVPSGLPPAQFDAGEPPVMIPIELPPDRSGWGGKHRSGW